MIPGAILPYAEICPEARELYLAQPSLHWEPLWREALHLGVKAVTADAGEVPQFLAAHRAALAALPPRLAIAVTEAMENHLEEVRTGVIPTVHRWGVGLDMDVNGDAPGRVEPSVGMRVDCAWNETGRDGLTTAVVLIHRIWEDEDVLARLDALTAGLAWSIMNEAPQMRVGSCIHEVGRRPRYKWSPTYGDGEMQTVLARVRRALLAPRAAVFGAHCTGRRCPALRVCSAWQIPALQGAHEALHPLQAEGHTKINAENVERVRRVVLAMKQIGEIGEARIRAYEQANGAA